MPIKTFSIFLREMASPNGITADEPGWSLPNERVPERSLKNQGYRHISTHPETGHQFYVGPDPYFRERNSVIAVKNGKIDMEVGLYDQKNGIHKVQSVKKRLSPDNTMHLDMFYKHILATPEHGIKALSSDTSMSDAAHNAWSRLHKDPEIKVYHRLTNGKEDYVFQNSEIPPLKPGSMSRFVARVRPSTNESVEDKVSGLRSLLSRVKETKKNTDMKANKYINLGHAKMNNRKLDDMQREFENNYPYPTGKKHPLLKRDLKDTDDHEEFARNWLKEE